MGVVCDPHSGSGTTLLSALAAGRVFLGTELMIGFVNQTISRMMDEGVYYEEFDCRTKKQKKITV